MTDIIKIVSCFRAELYDMSVSQGWDEIIATFADMESSATLYSKSSLSGPQQSASEGTESWEDFEKYWKEKNWNFTAENEALTLKLVVNEEENACIKILYEYSFSNYIIIVKSVKLEGQYVGISDLLRKVYGGYSERNKWWMELPAPFSKIKKGNLTDEFNRSSEIKSLVALWFDDIVGRF